jgi:hypothetical protein
MLIDAAIAAIRATEETVLRRRDQPRVMVGFLAGGEDEYSHHSRDELRDLIERRRAEGWQFMLIGAERFNPYAVARGFGIDDDAMVSCGHANGLMLGMIAVAEIACDFAGGLSDRVYFNDEQKRFAYDRYAECNETCSRTRSATKKSSERCGCVRSEEGMGLLKCNAPSWDVSTEEWEIFLARKEPRRRGQRRSMG